MASEITSSVAISIGETNNGKESRKNVAAEALRALKPPPKRRFSTQERTQIAKVKSDIMTTTKSKILHKSTSNLTKFNSTSFDAVASRRDSKSGIPMMSDSRFNKNIHKLGTVPNYLKHLKEKTDAERPHTASRQSIVKNEDQRKKPAHRLGELPSYLNKKPNKERPKSSSSQTTLKGDDDIIEPTIIIKEKPKIDEEIIRESTHNMFKESKRKLFETIKQIIFVDAAEGGDGAEAQQNILTNMQKSFKEIEESEAKNEADFEELWSNFLSKSYVENKTNTFNDGLDTFKNNEIKFRQNEIDLKHSRQMADRLKSDSLKKDNEIRNLKKECENLQEQNNETLLKVKKAQIQNERSNTEYKQRLRDLTEKLEQTQNLKLKLEDDFKRISNDSSTSSVHQKSLKAEISGLTHQKLELLKKLQEMETSLTEKKAFIEEMHELCRLNKEQAFKIKFLENEINAQKSQPSENNTQNCEFCDGCLKKEEIIVKLNDMIVKLQNQKSEYKESYANSQVLLQIRSELIKSNQEKEDMFQREINKLTKASDEKKSIMQQMNQEIKLKSEEIEMLFSSLGNKQIECSKKDKIISELERNNERFIEARLEFKEKFREIKKENEKMKSILHKNFDISNRQLMTGNMMNLSVERANTSSKILANFQRSVQENLSINDGLLNTELFAESRRDKRKNQQILNVKTYEF